MVAVREDRGPRRRGVGQRGTRGSDGSPRDEVGVLRAIASKSTLACAKGANSAGGMHKNRSRRGEPGVRRHEYDLYRTIGYSTKFELRCVLY